MINIMFNVIGKRNNQTSVADADRKSQTSGEREMPEMRFTEFSAFLVYPRVGVFRSASESDARFYFSLPYVRRKWS